MLGRCLENVREKSPLVQCITNYVTVNDVANILLACGGSPIMIDQPEEAADIASICSALYINIGTLNKAAIEGMYAAGRRALSIGHPILFDPVGAGASTYRTDLCLSIIHELKPIAIRANSSEVRALAAAMGISASRGASRGVDANAADSANEGNLDEMTAFLNEFVKKCGRVTAMTGPIDLISDGERCFVIRNGRPEMERITGTGCQLSGMMTAYVAANADNVLEAAAAAAAVMGVAGEIGFKALLPGEGNATYRNRIIDAVYNMDAAVLEEGVRCEIR